jgi:hypothetical protein
MSDDMSFRIKIIQKALLVSHDTEKMWKIFEECLEQIDFLGAQVGFREIELKRLRAQNERQTAMIDNYEKTFLKKK